MKFFLSKSIYQKLSAAELIETTQQLGKRSRHSEAWLRALELHRWDEVKGRERQVA